jgi:septal ring factor EnvC (AmiA/AmiB activator)
VDAARAIARRLRLPRSPSRDGKALVAVDVDKLKHRRRSPVGHAAKIETVLAEITQLASSVTMQRTDFERERARLDRLAADVAKLTDQAQGTRETAARLDDAIAALRGSLAEQPPSRLGRLTASVVQADRKASG